MVCEPTDPCWVYQGQLNMMSPSMVTVGSITSDISNVEPSFRQRTKAEAAVRAYEGLSNFNAFAKVPFFKLLYPILFPKLPLIKWYFLYKIYNRPFSYFS